MKQFKGFGSIERHGHVRPTKLACSSKTMTANKIAVSEEQELNIFSARLWYINVAPGIWVSRVCVYRNIYDSEVFAITVSSCVPLTSAHRRTFFIMFAKIVVFRIVINGGTIIFTDEFLFNLNANSPLTYIWRKPGMHFLPFNFREKDQYDRESLMIFASIMQDRRTTFLVFGKASMIDVRVRVICVPLYLISPVI